MSTDSETEEAMEKALVKAEPQKDMIIEPLSSLPADDDTPVSKLRPFQRRGPKVDIQALTLQCSACFKWRIVPSEDMYESIRETQKPWFCEDAIVWDRDVSCSDPSDVELKDSCEDTIWALDKPGLPKTPHGWKRELVIRGQGSTRFADIYYIPPGGRKLRSLVEVRSYLEKHPEHGVDSSQFCFATPQPVDKSYVRKRNPDRDVEQQNKESEVKKRKALPWPSEAATTSSSSAECPPVPQGWTRELKVNPLSKSCTVSYFSPCGKKIKSLAKMERFLVENPHYGLGVEEFSFIAPTSDDEIIEAASEPNCKLTIEDFDK